MQGAAKWILWIYKCDFLCPTNLKFLSQIKGNPVKDVTAFKFSISARGGRCYSSSRAPKAVLRHWLRLGYIPQDWWVDVGSCVCGDNVCRYGGHGEVLLRCLLTCVLSVCIQWMRHTLCQCPSDKIVTLLSVRLTILQWKLDSIFCVVVELRVIVNQILSTAKTMLTRPVCGANKKTGNVRMT
jgi:hypothetical protein